MKALRLVIALVLALAAQTTLAYSVTEIRGLLDLVLVLVIYVALRHGAVAGLVFGSAAGLCQDALSGGIIGVGGLAKSLVGVSAGTLATHFIVTSTLPRLVVFVGGSILHAVLFLGVYALIESTNLARPWVAVLTQAAANAAVGLLLFAAVERLPEAWRRRRMRRTHLRARLEA